MMLKRALPVVALTLLLAACETTAPLPPPPPPRPPTRPLPPPPPPPSGSFSPQDFGWSTQPGPGRINGHLAFGRGGYTCTGAGVVLMPETPFVRARMQTLYRSTGAAALPADEVRARTPAAPAGFSAYVRSTSCDKQNRFAFAGLAPGAWYVITVARPSAGKGEDMAIMRRVVITLGAPVNLEL